MAYDRIFGKRFLEETTETSLAKIFTVSNESSSLNFCSLQFIDSGCSLWRYLLNTHKNIHLSQEYSFLTKFVENWLRESFSEYIKKNLSIFPSSRIRKACQKTVDSTLFRSCLQISLFCCVPAMTLNVYFAHRPFSPGRDFQKGGILSLNAQLKIDFIRFTPIALQGKRS